MNTVYTLHYIDSDSCSYCFPRLLGIFSSESMAETGLLIILAQKEKTLKAWKQACIDQKTVKDKAQTIKDPVEQSMYLKENFFILPPCCDEDETLFDSYEIKKVNIDEVSQDFIEEVEA